MQKISVIMATKNRVKTIGKAIDSIINDEYPNKELIIKDAASTDGTVEILKSYGDRIKWISEPDSGEYFALNQGIGMATGEVIIFTTDDDVIVPGIFKSINEYFNKYPNIEVIIGNSIVYIIKNGERRIIKGTTRGGPQKIGYKHFLRGTSDCFGWTAFIRRDVFDKVGNFSTQYIDSAVEWLLRAAFLDIRFMPVNDVVLEYYRTDISGSTILRESIIKDQFRLVKKYGNCVDWIIVLFLRRIAEPTLNFLRKVLNKPELSIYSKKVK